MANIHSYQSIYEFVEETLKTFGFESEAITPDATFSNDFYLDSLDITELIMGMEINFDISIPFELIEQKCKTVHDLVTIIELQLKQKLVASDKKKTDA